MRLIIGLALLFLISCGGGSGSGLGVVGHKIGSPGSPITYPKGSGYETLAKFKSAVANNQWSQNPSFAYYNFYKFKYRDPGDTAGCSKIGEGIFSFSFCLNQGTATPVWVVEEKKGVISNALISLSRIKDIVSKASLGNPYTSLPNTTTPYAYFDGRQWIILLGSEIFTFDMAYPLGANPTYYKNTSGKEFSLANYEYSNIP